MVLTVPVFTGNVFTGNVFTGKVFAGTKKPAAKVATGAMGPCLAVL
jgi:hypothetical protein